ncbi:hypothetical protein AOLI_G00317610 [Acnodon oligacanthus]
MLQTIYETESCFSTDAHSTASREQPTELLPHSTTNNMSSTGNEADAGVAGDWTGPRTPRDGLVPREPKPEGEGAQLPLGSRWPLLEAVRVLNGTLFWKERGVGNGSFMVRGSSRKESTTMPLVAFLM